MADHKLWIFHCYFFVRILVLSCFIFLCEVTAKTILIIYEFSVWIKCDLVVNSLNSDSSLGRLWLSRLLLYVSRAAQNDSEILALNWASCLATVGQWLSSYHFLGVSSFDVTFPSRSIRLQSWTQHSIYWGLSLLHVPSHLACSAVSS